MSVTRLHPASAERATPRSLTIVIAACAASAGAHAALVPQHLEHEPRLGTAFVIAVAVLLALAAALTYRPGDASVFHATTVVLAGLIGAYALNVTAGLPWLSSGAEPIDLVGLATKAVEALGLWMSIQLNPNKGGHGSLTYEEART